MLWYRNRLILKEKSKCVESIFNIIIYKYMIKCKNVIFNNCNNIMYITFTYITKYIYFHVIAIIKN